MAYLTRLIHRAAVHRPTVTQSDTGVRKATYSVVTGMSAVRCLLQSADAARVQQLFGADIQADALVMFPAGTDIRPNITQADGANDQLVITDELNQITRWAVTAVRDPATSRKMVVAAVRRVGQ